ncbi:MAG: class I SAM-dependent methyltransferase [Cyanobacteria bacterium SZAS-4]|nr:class I SAM-dependent methyltransferase [Cyanobacteria bacterium SZAS-4]
MEVAEYDNIFANESTHFYYVAVHDCIIALIKRYAFKGSPLRILDAGCGTGFLAKKLKEFGDVEAVDMHDQAIQYARNRGLSVTKASVEKLPFAPETFDLLTSIDVIYHKFVEDDVEALRQFYSVLKPGGYLVLRVPAKPSLHSSHDHFVHTARRYERTDLRSKLKQVGFEIEVLTYCQGSLFIPAWVKARMDQQTATKQHSVIEHQSRWLNRAISAILKMENRMILAGFDIPTGIGLVTVCRKPLR